MMEDEVWRKRARGYRFTAEEADLAVFGVGENKKRALSRGLTVEYGRLTVERVGGFLREGFIPLALVHMGVVHQLDIPHWVVLADVDERCVSFNDPYPPKGGKGLCVRRDEFQKMLDDVGTRIGLSPSVVFINNVKKRISKTGE
jgi:hypothetical protein